MHDRKSPTRTDIVGFYCSKNLCSVYPTYSCFLYPKYFVFFCYIILVIIFYYMFQSIFYQTVIITDVLKLITYIHKNGILFYVRQYFMVFYFLSLKTKYKLFEHLFEFSSVYFVN